VHFGEQNKQKPQIKQNNNKQKKRELKYQRDMKYKDDFCMYLQYQKYMLISNLFKGLIEILSKEALVFYKIHGILSV